MAGDMSDGRLAVELGDEELTAVMAVVAGAVAVDVIREQSSATANVLLELDLISEHGTTDKSATLFEGLTGADRMVQVNVLGPDLEDDVRVFIAPTASTLICPGAGGRHLVERLDPADMPREVAAHMRLLTGLAGEDLVIHLAQDILDSAFEGDAGRTADLLSAAVEDQEELRTAMLAGDWLFRMMLVDQMEDGEPITHDLVLLLSIGTRMFSVQYDTTERGEHRADTIVPMSAWARVSGWFSLSPS